MKLAELEKTVFISCFIDFDDIHDRYYMFDYNSLACISNLCRFLDIFRPNFEEDHHNFAGIDIKAELSLKNVYIVEIDNAAY